MWADPPLIAVPPRCEREGARGEPGPPTACPVRRPLALAVAAASSPSSSLSPFTLSSVLQVQLSSRHGTAAQRSRPPSVRPLFLPCRPCARCALELTLNVIPVLPLVAPVRPDPLSCVRVRSCSFEVAWEVANVRPFPRLSPSSPSIFSLASSPHLRPRPTPSSSRRRQPLERSPAACRATLLTRSSSSSPPAERCALAVKLLRFAFRSGTATACSQLDPPLPAPSPSRQIRQIDSSSRRTPSRSPWASCAGRTSPLVGSRAGEIDGRRRGGAGSSGGGRASCSRGAYARAVPLPRRHLEAGPVAVPAPGVVATSNPPPRELGANSPRRPCAQSAASTPSSRPRRPSPAPSMATATPSWARSRTSRPRWRSRPSSGTSPRPSTRVRRPLSPSERSRRARRTSESAS